MFAVNISDFGAAPNGTQIQTQAIQSAIDHVHTAGGGTVHMPIGKYRIGTIFIRSNVNLHLAPQAELVGSEDISDYPLQNYGSPHPTRHLVMFDHAQRASLTGEGTINGSAAAFCEPPFDTPGWIVAKAERPAAMVCAVKSQDVLIQGVRLFNPPNWNCDLFECDRVRVNGLKIINDGRWPNNDGIDISGCNDVIISDCHIETGDDAIVINTRTRPTRRVVITNCILRTECAALKIGWEWTPYDISQVAISNCVLVGCNRGIASYACDGQSVEDVTISNIVYDSNGPVMFARPIHLDLRKSPKTGKIGVMRNFSISNVVARTQGRILMTAEDGGMLENITLRDVHLIYPYIEDPMPIADGNRSAQFSNPCREARKARAAVVMQNVKDVYIDNLRTTWPSVGEVPAEWRHKTKRENGPTRIFEPDWSTTRPADFALVWAKNVSGIVNAPFGSGSSPAANDDIDATSRLTVRKAT